MLSSKWRGEKRRTEMKDKNARVNTSHTVHGYSKCIKTQGDKYDHILATQRVLLVERELYLCGFRLHLLPLLSVWLLFFSLKGKKNKGSISRQLIVVKRGVQEDTFRRSDQRLRSLMSAMNHQGSFNAFLPSCRNYSDFMRKTKHLHPRQDTTVIAVINGSTIRDID